MVRAKIDRYARPRIINQTLTRIADYSRGGGLGHAAVAAESGRTDRRTARWAGVSARAFNAICRAGDDFCRAGDDVGRAGDGDRAGGARPSPARAPDAARIRRTVRGAG